jgi:replicative DNA helicase
VNVDGLRVPPHSTEAEQSIIGALLVDNQAFDSVSWLTADAFYADGHRRIWQCIVRMLEAGKAADIVTVCDDLGPVELERAGGPAYLASLAQNTPSALNVRRYADLVRQKHMLRELAQRATGIAEQALSGAADPAQIIEEAEASILEVRDTHDGRRGEAIHIGQACTEYVEWVDENPNGIETGFVDLDSLTGGLMPGNLVLIAGRPSMGKTALALQFSENISATVPGLMFSLEATRREIAGRLIEWHKHRAGRDAAVDKVFNLKFFIDDSAGITTGTMRARLRRVKRKHGLSLVVVDYLQLMRGRGDSREQEVASISRDLKAIAKDFQVPVVALAQLSRKVEERSDKRPTMADLRESGALEQDADVILFPFRPDYYDSKFEAPLAEAEIIVAKNRNNGRTGVVKVMFARDLNRFGDFVPERYRSEVA